MTRRTSFLFAGFVFLTLLFKPAAIMILRASEAAYRPQVWSQVRTNTRFAVLLPRLFASRLHDEALYAARAHRVLTHGFPYNPYWSEDRDLKDWLQGFPVYFVLAGFSSIVGGDMNAGWVIAAATFAAIWFIVFDTLFFGWCKKREVSVPLALFSILFPDLYGWAFDINFDVASNIARYADVFIQQGALIRPNFYRLPAGFMTLLILTFALIAVYRLAIKIRPAPVLAVLTGIGFGGLFFCHAYAHVVGLAALGSMVIVSHYTCSRTSRNNLAVAFLLSVCVSLAATVHMNSLVDVQTRTDSLEIVGLEHAHRFYLVSLVHILLAGIGLFALRRETENWRRGAWLALIGLQLGVFAARASQVITGITVQPHHFIPIGSFFGCGIFLFPLTRWLAGRKWWNMAFALAVSSLVIIAAVSNDAVAARRSYRLFGLSQDLSAGLDWIAENLPKDSTVASLSMEVNEAIPLYTSSSVLVPPASPPVVTLFSKERYYQKVAQLLVACGADAPRFLNERWLIPREKVLVQTRMGKALHAGQDSAREDFEQSEWFHPFFWGVNEDGPVLTGRERIVQLTSVVPPLQRPYYVWLDDADSRFLNQPLSSRGGKLEFRNGSVAIYSFVAAQ